jgi:acetolactate synthase-1/2/3 large subunit
MPAPEPNAATEPSNVAQLLLYYLQLEKAKCLFGIPGGALARILQTLREPEQRKFFRYIVCRHETGAAYMAEGYFRATGRPGVVLATSGPGATNALTGTLTAQFGGSALITITGEPREEFLGRGYLQEGIETGLNIDAIYTAAASYSAILTNPTSAKTLIEQALRDAMSIPRYAVHLSIPDDIAAADFPKSGDGIAPLPKTTKAYRSVTQGAPDSNDITEVCDLLQRAKHPLIFLGSGCRDALRNDSNAARALRSLVERYAIPVMTTMDGKGLFPESHEFSFRTYGFASCRWPHHWLGSDNREPRLDALLVIGSALGELSTNKWYSKLIPEEGKTFIQVDIEPRVLGRGFNVTHGIVADAGEFMRAVSDCLLSRNANDDLVFMREVAVKQIKKESPFAQKSDYQSGDYWSDYYADEKAEPIEPAALVRVVQQNFLEEKNGETMIFIDSGNCVGWGAHYFVVDPPNEYHSTLGMGPMGFGVAGVIGAKLGKTEAGNKKCVCLALVGDGAFLMHGAELSTAAAHKVGAIWIVLADDDLRMVTQGMAQYVTYDPNFDPADSKFNFEGLYRLGKPDLVKFAASLGAEAREASNLKQLRGAVLSAKTGAKEGKPQVVVAHIDPRRVPPYYLPPYTRSPQPKKGPPRVDQERQTS